MTVEYNGRIYRFRECDTQNITQEELQKRAKKGKMQYEPHAVWFVVPGVGYGWETEE